MKITVGIPTKNRYDSLCQTLLSIALQSFSPVEVIIVDDSDNPVDLRTITHYAYIFKLFYEKGIDWKLFFGQKKGQHHSHELIQREAKGDFIFRIDDDEVAESDVLLKLSEYDYAGAVAPLVLMPLQHVQGENPALLPKDATNRIDNLSAPNIQWHKWEKDAQKIKQVDHLYSCFLYKKGITNYELSLSPVAHREETIFSYKIKKAGHKLLVNSDAIVWHFREEKGGIRSYNDKSMYDHDEKVFEGLLNLWGVKKDDSKFICLDNGIGDHYAFKNILYNLRKRHKKITIAACFPDVFWDEKDIELISIQEAQNRYADLSSFNIYAWMDRNNWNRSLTEAFEEFYL